MNLEFNNIEFAPVLINDREAYQFVWITNELVNYRGCNVRIDINSINWERFDKNAPCYYGHATGQGYYDEPLETNEDGSLKYVPIGQWYNRRRVQLQNGAEGFAGDVLFDDVSGSPIPKQIQSLVKGKILRACSIGFPPNYKTVKTIEKINGENLEVETWFNIEIHEISIVGIPVALSAVNFKMLDENPNAKLDDILFVGKTISNSNAEILKAVKGYLDMIYSMIDTLITKNESVPVPPPDMPTEPVFEVEIKNKDKPDKKEMPNYISKAELHKLFQPVITRKDLKNILTNN